MCGLNEVKGMNVFMNLKWDLTDLFDSNEGFYKEFENIKIMLSNIKKYQNLALDENLLIEVLNEKWEIKELANNVLVYGSLMYYKNVNSNECIELKKDAENLNTLVNSELGFIDRKILSLGKEKIEDFINKNDKLEIYKLSLENLFRMQEHIQNDDVI